MILTQREFWHQHPYLCLHDLVHVFSSVVEYRPRAPLSRKKNQGPVIDLIVVMMETKRGAPTKPRECLARLVAICVVGAPDHGDHGHVGTELA